MGEFSVPGHHMDQRKRKINRLIKYIVWFDKLCNHINRETTQLV